VSSDPLPVALATAERLRLSSPIFISDLHLNAASPATLARFLRFCTQDANRHAELLILGDLFEYWIGDDTLEDPADTVSGTVAAALRDLTHRGVALYVMHGNRDLLLGAGFLRATGAQLLADPALADIDDRRVLLAHGDAWCTRDVEYMRFRASVRQEAAQRQFLASPRAARLAFMGAARQQSEAGKRAKAMEIMDVTPAAVDDAMRAHGVRVLIHGHTHRPATHRFTLDGEPAERWVLPDWDFDARPTRGGAIAARDGQFTSVALDP
jgi:UDP-2,3-diacylglucosamine hydrolase